MLLQVEALEAGYDDALILRGISLEVGAEQIVAEGEGAGVNRLAEARPVEPIILGQSIFDADDGVSPSPFANHFDHAAGIERKMIELVAAILIKVARSQVDGD